MPNEPLDPFEALKAIRKLAEVALEAEKPERVHDLTLRAIIQACENALPSKPRRRTKPQEPPAAW